jgi:cytochrome b6-f complex iron-sulfur subunit
MKNGRLSRRKFLNRLWIGAGVIAAAEAAALVFGFFRPRRPRTAVADGETLVEAGPIDQFEPGSVHAFVRGKFYLARLEDGGFLALSRQCTHLNCTVPWVADEERFVCPCHSSVFDIRGSVINPPAPRALDLFPVSIDKGIVQVDTARVIKRGRFTPDQVLYPGQT